MALASLAVALPAATASGASSLPRSSPSCCTPGSSPIVSFYPHLQSSRFTSHAGRWNSSSKWIKQHLRIKAFYGLGENAVKTQIWIAVVYVLVHVPGEGEIGCRGDSSNGSPPASQRRRRRSRMTAATLRDWKASICVWVASRRSS